MGLLPRAIAFHDLYKHAKLFDVIKVHLPTVYCYVDDTQLYVSFSPNKSIRQFEAVIAIQHCVDDMRNWMTSD